MRCSWKEAVVFDQSILSRFGSATGSQFAGRTFYQSRIWSSTHERAAPTFERTLSSRSLNSSRMNSTCMSAAVSCIRGHCIVCFYFCPFISFSRLSLYVRLGGIIVQALDLTFGDRTFSYQPLHICSHAFASVAKQYN